MNPETKDKAMEQIELKFIEVEQIDPNNQN